MIPPVFPNVTLAWQHVLQVITQRGLPVAPRGEPTYEVLDNAVAFAADSPILDCSARRLSYRFLAAEALWILEGRDDVDGIAPFNKRIAAFSDDGETFFGAYGPKIIAQLDHVVGSLVRDRESRQAVINIWRENPPPTKDVPCTLSIGFTIRLNRLHAHVAMRSSDAWLGLPYDAFNYAMLLLNVALRLNQHPDNRRPVGLGLVFWRAASSHLYDRDRTGVQACLDELAARRRQLERATPHVSDDFVKSADVGDLLDALARAREDRAALEELAR